MSDSQKPLPLSPDARRSVAAFRELGRLSPDAREALRQRIGASIAARGGHDAEPRARGRTRSTESPPIDVAASAWRIGVALSAAAGVLLAIRLTAGIGGTTRDPDLPGRGGDEAQYGVQPSATPRSVEPRTTPRTRSASSPNKAEPAVEPPSPAAVAPSDGTSPSAQQPRLRRSTTATPQTSAAAPDDTLAVELAMMRQARAALRRGAAGLALTILDEHARRFDDGQMLEDRQALRVQALCDAGRRSEAREAARRFAHEHPGSPHRGRVGKICPES